MMTMRHCSNLVVIFLASAFGCSKGPSLNTVPISGKVTLDGQPLSGASVTFLPEAPAGGTEALSPSSGLTSADGSYKLITMGSGRAAFDGAPPGNYKIIVTKRVSSDTTTQQTALMGNDPNFAQKMQSMSNEELEKMRGGGTRPDQRPPPAPKSEVPERYGKPDTSGLTATVGASGAQTFDFPLTTN